MENWKFENWAKSALVNKGNKTPNEEYLLETIIAQDIFKFTKEMIEEEINMLTLSQTVKEKINYLNEKIFSDNFKKYCLGRLLDIYEPNNKKDFINSFYKQWNKFIEG